MILSLLIYNFKRLTSDHSSFLISGSTYPVAYLAFPLGYLKAGQIQYVPNEAHDSPFNPNNSTFPLGLPISINTTITQLGAHNRDLGVVLDIFLSLTPDKIINLLSFMSSLLAFLAYIHFSPIPQRPPEYKLSSSLTLINCTPFDKQRVHRAIFLSSLLVTSHNYIKSTMSM